MKLSRPITVGRWTFRGVDDWGAFCTDPFGDWFCFQTECSPCWPLLPDSFIGPDGYPDTAEGVLATAILEAQSGINPKPVPSAHRKELSDLFWPEQLKVQRSAAV